MSFKEETMPAKTTQTANGTPKAQRPYPEVVEMLTYPRPHDSQTEDEWRRKFIAPVCQYSKDARGNLIFRIGDDPRVLFSAHTDTVHAKEDPYEIEYDPQAGIVQAGGKVPLGADDGAGVWLLLELIRHGVSGLYIFHSAEEVGGQGSAHIADNTPTLLQGIDIAVAFDRRDDGDIITHQGGSMCASDEFAYALAAELGGNYGPDPTGSFTDTANYTDLVAECTNISTGYRREHSKQEWQDLNHLYWLRDRILEVDWANLPITRMPGEDDSIFGFLPSYGGQYRPGTGNADIPSEDATPTFKRATWWDLYDFVTTDPMGAADALEDFGLTLEEIAAYATYNSQ